MGLFLAGLMAGAVLAGGIAAWLWRRRSRRLGRYFSFAAHEINAPITAVKMTLFNLAEGVFGRLEEPQAAWVEKTRAQAARLAALVGELRDLADLELAGELSLRLQDLAPAEIVETALKSVRPISGLENGGLQLALEPDLPSVRADVERLPRMLLSLFHHARKFRASGDILVGARAAGAGVVEFRVEYLGQALGADEALRALRLYYPAERGKNQTLGVTGLGLGLLRVLARRQGGDLRYDVDASGRSCLALLFPALKGQRF